MAIGQQIEFGSGDEGSGMVEAASITAPDLLESIDPQEDFDLLAAVENEALPEEIRLALNQDETDTVKLIDVNAPESEAEVITPIKEPPRRKPSNQNLVVLQGESCRPKLDLVFLLHTSGAIQRIYQEHVRWAVALVDSLPIEPDTVRVAAVQYAGFPLTEFALGTYPSADDIRQHLANINFRPGVTRTGYALRKAEAELFRQDRGARDDAVKVIILFTDGASVDDPLKPAQQLRDLKGVKIYVVCLKPQPEGLPQMDRIAGDSDNVFGPHDLKRLRETLISEAEKTRACSRIGDVIRPFKSPRFNGANSISSFVPKGGRNNQTSGGGSQTPERFRQALADITELSRAAAAISAARLPDRSTTTTPVPTTTTKRPFLGVRVIESMEQDVFEDDRSAAAAALHRANPSRRPLPAASTTTSTSAPVQTTKKSIKLSSEKAWTPTGRREFTTPTPTASTPPPSTTTTSTPPPTPARSTRFRIPIVQNAVPLFTGALSGEKTSPSTPYIPTWRRTPTTVQHPLTTTTQRSKTARVEETSTSSETPQTTTSGRRLQHIQRIVQTVQPPSSRRPAPTTSTARPPTATQLIQRARSFATAGACPHDLLFIIDSSGSIQKSYDIQKAYLLDLLSRIQIGNETHRVALLQFAGSRIQKTEWTYDSFVDSPALMRATEQIRYLTGTTFIGAALSSARQILESRRRDVPSLVVLLSDGFSQDDATRAAEQIRALPNLEFYALSVSDLSNMQLLTTLVGSEKHVFTGGESDELKHLILNRLHCRV
ncbi:hypothetical protein M3Y99_01923000 [Aphelenchoides fujianensis]|nr:hypothetical protein M3Y99_01923000 [Aphelenchoides fujianensis]